jgi:hypothetical protein
MDRRSSGEEPHPPSTVRVYGIASWISQNVLPSHPAL